jgi:hypothetical protein
MSGQVDMDSITHSIRNARNRFVRDVLFPVSHHYPGAPTPVTADGIVDYPQGTMFIHRATWQDSGSGSIHCLCGGRVPTLWISPSICGLLESGTTPHVLGLRHYPPSATAYASTTRTKGN